MLSFQIIIKICNSKSYNIKTAFLFKKLEVVNVIFKKICNINNMNI